METLSLYKLKTLVLLTVLMFFCMLVAHDHTISQINSIEEVKHILEKVDSQTLVIFDVDETLIIPTDRIHLPKFFLEGKGRDLKQEFEKAVGDRVEHIWSNVLLQAKREIIEPHIVTAIKMLQDKNVKVIALTKMQAGPYGKIESLAEYRFAQLERLGLNFHSSFSQNLTFKQFPWRFNAYPTFYNGILLSNEEDKGIVLGALLDELNYKPGTIIFFDDRLENVLSVRDEAITRKISFQGFHYTRADTIANTLDYDIAKFQLDYLVKHEKWLSEDEVKESLSKLPQNVTQANICQLGA